jgi:hypothetical protein
MMPVCWQLNPLNPPKKKSDFQLVNRGAISIQKNAPRF